LSGAPAGYFSPNFGWNNIALQDELKKHLPFNVLVENANRALVIGEIKNTQPNPTSCIVGLTLDTVSDRR